ncbi:hypothetical protein LCGC14_2031240, partial [marine sediment metagenome]
IATLLTIAEARQPQPVTLYDLTAYEARQASVKAQPVTAQLLDYDSLRAVYQSAHDEELPKWSRGWAKSAAENAGMTAVAKAQDVKTWTFAQQRIKELETLVRDASEWELQDGANVPDDWLNQAQQVIPDIKE